MTSASEESYYTCCSNPLIIVYRGQYICSNCATAHGSEMLPNSVNLQYSTIFDDVHAVFRSNNPQYVRMFRVNKFCSSVESAKKIAKRYLSIYSGTLEISYRIRSNAFKLFEQALSLRLTIGRSIEKFCVACLYAACRSDKCLISIREFSQVSNLSIKLIRKYYYFLIDNLRLKIERPKLVDYVVQVTTSLKLSDDEKEHVYDMLDFLKSKKISDNLSYLYAIIYISTRDRRPKISQLELVKLGNMTEVTLRKYVKIVKKLVDGVSYKVRYPCVRCGFCCTTIPCSHGDWNTERARCRHLTLDNKCEIYEQIKGDPFMGFGEGCSSPLFNTVRQQKLKEMREK